MTDSSCPQVRITNSLGDPSDPQGLQRVEVGDLSLWVETPPDLDALLDRAAEENPQAVDSIPYYAILWPSALGLARYLWQIREEWKGVGRIAELGCGLGLPSVLVAKSGVPVLATDFHQDAGPWLTHNAAINQTEVPYRSLDWEMILADPATAAPFRSDWVIGSDLLYEKRHIPALICSINRICTGRTAIFADPGRAALDLFVMGMEESGWKFTLIPVGDIYVCRFDRMENLGGR